MTENCSCGLKRSETDQGHLSPLHTLGNGRNQAMPGGILKDTTLTGSRAGGAALVSVIAALVELGATDSTVA